MHKIYTTFRSKESQEKINSIVRLEQGITLKTANINSWDSKFWQIHDLNKQKKKNNLVVPSKTVGGSEFESKTGGRTSFTFLVKKKKKSPTRARRRIVAHQLNETKTCQNQSETAENT